MGGSLWSALCFLIKDLVQTYFLFIRQNLGANFSVPKSSYQSQKCPVLPPANGFGLAVSSLCDSALLEAFPFSAIKKCLICKKSAFSCLSYSIFFSENTAIHCHLVPNTLEMQSITRFLFLQRQHSKRLHNVITYKHSKHNSFDL